MSIGEQFKSLLETTADRLGYKLKVSSDEVKAYVSMRMLHLAAVVGEPGFDLALLAERDNVAMFFGISATNTGDAADVELRGVILGALSIGAKALAFAV